MLLDFCLRNYKSFDEGQVVSWRKEQGQSWPCLLLLGSNAAGKSNFLEGFALLRRLLMASPGGTDSVPSMHQPFALRGTAERQPSEWELQIQVPDGRTFRYGIACSAQAIAAEWLFCNEQPCFVREKQELAFWNAYQDARPLLPSLGHKESALAFLAHYRVADSYALQQTFRSIQYIDQVPEELYHPALPALLNDISRRRLLFKILEIADLGIREIEMRPSAPGALQPTDLYVRQDFYTAKGNLHGSRPLPLLEAGGRGLRQLLYYACAILEACWKDQYLIIDNYADGLHPNLALALLDLFAQQRDKAQLLVASPQIQLLQEQLFQPQQVYFAEKQQKGHSRLYRLSDFDNLPKPWLQNYLKGRFGALPILRHWPRISRWKLFQ